MRPFNPNEYDTTQWMFTHADSDKDDLSWQQLAEMKHEHHHSDDKDTQGFEGSEHRKIGDQGFHNFLESDDGEEFIDLLDEDFFDTSGEVSRFKINDNLWLSAGEIVALAGDFYGVADEPICDGSNPEARQQRFINAYNTLRNANPEEVKAILKVLDEEERVVEQAKHLGYEPNLAFELISDDGNKKFASILRHSKFAPSLLCSRYTDLAKMNFDHFQDQALAAYEAGLAVATSTISTYEDKPTDAEKAECLNQATAQLFFACHFLTDLFAAGHIRTPRKALRHYVAEKATVTNALAGGLVAGLLAKAMHDEDNKSGLIVKSEKDSKGWKAYGDKCAFSVSNASNYDKAIEIVAVALGQLFSAYRGEGELKDEHKKYLPTLKDSNQNPYPLFKETKDGKVLRRLDMDDIHCGSTLEDWSPVVTAKHLLKKMRSTTDNTELKALEAELKAAQEADDSSWHKCSVM